ncbi:MAG: N-acetyltransferase [Pseudomonadota bacterium]
MSDTSIRERTAADDARLDTLYREAFPDEDLRPVVHALHTGEAKILSLVAVRGEKVVGNVIFTECSLPDHAEPLSLLAPLGVTPAEQRQGIGTKLVEEGFRRLTAAGIAKVFVLGDPAYYGRLGFEVERAVATPQPIPEDWAGAWQSISLGRASGGAAAFAGTLDVPDPWRNPALWAP